MSEVQKLTLEYAEKYGFIEPCNLPLMENLMKEKKDGTLLDLGCASNRSYIEYRYGLCKNFIGVNSEKIVSANIRKDKPHKQFDNFHYVHSDAKYLPLKDNSVDVVTMLGLMGPLDYISNRFKLDHLEHTIESLKRTQKERMKRLIEDSYRVLKKCGILIISNKDESSPMSSTEELVREYFNDVQLVLGSERYLLICRKD
jgi:ubiquinone/menaquinone biosynthesis C-methylase UbiE